MKKLNKKAFTIFELILVMALLGTLVLLCTPKILDRRQEAELLIIMANTNRIETASKLYYMDHGDWPRLSDEPYTAEQIDSYAKSIFDKTGKTIELDSNGKYYDVDYTKLKGYIEKPKDSFNYVLQNPVGDVFYLGKTTDLGEERVAKIVEKEKVFESTTNQNKINQLIIGDKHGIILSEDNIVWVWGKNDDGRLGLGHNKSQPVPTRLNFKNVKQLDTGNNFTIAVKNDGTVWAWGSNDSGQLGIEGVSSTNYPVKVNINDVVQISAGAKHVIALKSDGTLWGWGNNAYGQLGISSKENKYIPTKIDILDVRRVETGGEHTIVIKEDNSIWGWGNNAYGQLGIGSNENKYTPIPLNINNIKSIEAGYYHTAFLKNDNTLWMTGYNGYGELALGDSSNRNIPTKVNMENIKQVALGKFSTMVIDTNDNLFGAGNNYNFQYGGGQIKQLTFIQININNVKSVESSGDTFFLMKNDKTFWVAGCNDYYHLGLGDIVVRTTPTQIHLGSVQITPEAGNPNNPPIDPEVPPTEPCDPPIDNSPTTIYDSGGNLRYVGYIVDGKYNGEGILYENDKKVYEGNWVNGKKEGRGTLYHPSSKVIYNGNWANDKKEGYGKLYHPDGTLIYDGNWSNDMRNGYGISYDTSGKKEYEGMWRNDVFQN